MVTENTIATIPFHIGLVAALIIGGFLWKTLRLKQHGAMNVIANTTALILLSAFIMNVFLVIGHLNEISDVFADTNEEAAYAVGYALYFIFFIIGNRRFLKSIIRLPAHRRGSFNWVNRLLNLQVLLTVILSVFTSGFIASVRSNPDYNDFVEASFALISQIAIISFVYFYRALGTERDKNASKLLKARLQLMRYSILTQILMSLGILIGALFLATNTGNSNHVEFYIFTFISIITVLFSVITYMSITIPNRVRVAYNIAPRRFQFIAPANN